MKLRHLWGATLVVGALSLTSAFAAGLWPGFPLLGGASYCISSVNGSCVSTVPAGPTNATGRETIPADTHQVGESQPQTINIPITEFNLGVMSGPITTGTAYTVPANVNTVILNLGAATMAVTTPANPTQNEILTIANVSTTAISSFSVVANTGQSLVAAAAPTNLAAQTNNSAAAASPYVSYIYNVGTTSWYRLR